MNDPLGPPTIGQDPGMGGQSPMQPEPQSQAPQQPNQASWLDPSQDKAKVEADAHRLVTRGIQLLNSPGVSDSVVNSLKNSPNIVQGVADQARAIIQRIDAATRKEGVELNAESKIYGGMGIVAEIAEIASASGAGELDEDDKELAFSVSVQDYLKEEIAAGRLDPEELKSGLVKSLQGMSKEDMETANQAMLRINSAAERLKGKQPEEVA